MITDGLLFEYTKTLLMFTNIHKMVEFIVKVWTNYVVDN